MNPETVSSGSPAPPDPDSTEVSGFLRPTRPGPADSRTGVVGISAFARLASGLGLRSGSPALEEEAGGHGFVESLARGFVDTSRSAVRAVQVKARHAVSQNKRRYQEGEFDLDMAYITENIIAMGFPAGDLSSGLFGFIEGFYRNHMEEVINFFETHHQGKYKVYNLCAERLYDASKFQGKVACFPFDDHNCPPIQLITSFCQSAYSWLKEDIQNVVVVHCKAGMGRTGLMICSLLMFLKFFPTAEEAIEYFNQKRCVDGKALVLPSQIRYVKYFGHLLKEFNGEDQPGRRCMLRGFRLHQCPYWIRPSITISDHSRVLFSTRYHPKTKNLMPEDFWIKVPKRNIVVFALPGQPGVTELTGDIKIQFHDRQGDFYCWLNTTFSENRMILDGCDLDGFDKRKLPSPGFKLEILTGDYDATVEMRSKAQQSTSKSSEGTGTGTSADGVAQAEASAEAHRNKGHENDDDDVFSDSDEENRMSNSRETRPSGGIYHSSHSSSNVEESTRTLTSKTEQLSLQTQVSSDANASNGFSTEETSKPATDHSMDVSDIKSMAADASVFSFGDEEDYESE